MVSKISMDVDPVVLSKPWTGVVELTYDQQADRTRLRSAYAQAPLKIQRSFYPESSGICHTVLLHTAGGMVAGDCLHYRLCLEPTAAALMTTAAAAKIYRSDGLVAQQHIDIQLAAGAYLEWLPQETILFEGAQFQQRLTVSLEPGATWVGWDIYRFGRTARDECFITGQWRSHCEVWQGTLPLWIDRQYYEASGERGLHPHALKGYSVVGTFAWLGVDIESALLQELRNLPFAGIAQADLGMTRLQHGLVCRYRGHSTAQARDWFTQIWNHMRCFSLGHPASPPRVWQL